MNSLYLQHHGIKGQKWGIRRYQNPDGSLTTAGRERYFNTTAKYNNKKGNYDIEYTFNRKTKRGSISKEQYDSIKKKANKLASEDARYYIDHYKNMRLSDIEVSKEYKKQFDDSYKSYMSEHLADAIFRSEHNERISKIMKNSNYTKEQAESFYQMTGSDNPNELSYEILFNKDGSTTSRPKKKKKG